MAGLWGRRSMAGQILVRCPTDGARPNDDLETRKPVHAEGILGDKQRLSMTEQARRLGLGFMFMCESQSGLLTECDC